MPSAIIREITHGLPRSLQESIEGYVDAVRAAMPEIEREASVKLELRQIDEFLVVVTVRRLWATVNRQYWTMHDSIEIARRSLGDGASPHSTVRGFRMGREEVSSDSAPFRESKLLRTNLEALLNQLGIRELTVEATSLTDLARRMFGTIQ